MINRFTQVALAAIATVFLTLSASAQCVINTSYLSGYPNGGVYPAASALPHITQNVAYDQTVQGRIESGFDTTVNSVSMHVQVDSIRFDSIVGLPNGISYTRNPVILPGGGYGCVEFTGTTNDPAGTYQLTAYGMAWTHIIASPPIIGPIDTPYVYNGNLNNWSPFGGYYLVVDGQLTANVTTNAATNITSSSATLNGTVNANGASTTTQFEWGLTTAYSGGTVTATPSPVTGSSNTSISHALSGLTPNTTYHYQALGTNTGGTALGGDMTFTTQAVTSCTPVPGTRDLSPTPDAVPCASQGVAFSQTYTFSVPDTFLFAGTRIAVDSVTIDSINNLPSGLSWAASNNPATYRAGTSGCYIISGTTNAACGTYLFYIIANVYLRPGINIQLNIYVADSIQFPRQYIRVNSAGNSCQALDTTQKVAFVPNVSCAGASSTAACANGRFQNYVFSNFTIDSVVYSTRYNLKMDIYQPTGDTLSARPLIVLAHGGSFISGTRNSDMTIDSLCMNFARRGYVTASIDYRLGSAINMVTDSGYALSKIFGAVSDFKAAVRYFYKDALTTNTYKIDTSHIYIGGNSSGAIMALHFAYIDSVNECPQDIQTIMDTSGFLPGNSGNAGYSNNVKAVINLAGALNEPGFLGPGSMPVASAQGDQDVTVPYNCGLYENGSVNVRFCGLGVMQSYINANTTGSVSLVFPGSGHAPWASNASMFHQVDTLVTDFLLNQVCTGTIINPLSVPINNVNEVNCYGQSTGSATAAPTGGTGIYTYAWSNTATTATASNLAAGAYTVTVTSGGQTAYGSVNITQPASAVSASAASTQTSCGSNTGTATVTPSGGTTGYTYLWNNNATTAQITNVGVGNYTVVVTDGKGCTASAGTSLNTSATFTINVSSTNVNCFGQSTGTATVTASGTAGNVTYSWSNSATTSSISNVGAGVYGVTVTNAGCSKAGSTTVTQPSAAVSASAVATQTACSSHTGTATITATGGTPGYTYSWSNSTTSNPATGLGAGTLTATVSDSKGCSVTTSATVSLPPSFSVSVNASTINCFGQSTGSATATVTGSGSFTYFWSNGATSSGISSVPAATYTVTVTDGFGCTQTANGTVNQPGSGVSASVQTTQTSCTGSTGTATASVSGGSTPYSYSWSNSQTNSSISNLGAGNYSVTVTDHGGCTVSAAASVSSPATFTLTIDTVGVQCHGASTGSVSATVNGATPPVTYNWGNGVTTASNANVVAGTYNVTVTDGNGCSKAASGVVTQPATALVANATATNSSCGNTTGTATVSVAGGNGNPTYLWSTNATSSSISGLGVGVYKVTVTEGNCTASSSALVNNNNGPSVTILPTNPTCPGGTDGSAVAVPSGGTPGYTYTWTGGATGNSINNKSAGTYTVIVQDATQCQATNTVTLIAPPAITFNPNITNETCHGDQTGSITLSAGGGTGPYTYLWYNGNTTPSVSNLLAGNYSVTVTDSKQCAAVSNMNVSQPALLSVTTTTTNATATTTGTASANVTGGTVPYLYNWTDGQSTSTATGLAQGNYAVTVTDIKGCSATASASILLAGINETENELASVKLFPNPSDGQVTIQLSGIGFIGVKIFNNLGQSIYTQSLDAIGQEQNINLDLSNVAGGVYTVQVIMQQGTLSRRLALQR